MKYIKKFEESGVSQSTFRTNKCFNFLSAVEHNDLEKVKRWVKRHPGEIDIETTDGETALIWAASYGYFDIAKFLIDNGADINHKTPWNKTPLYWAADSPYSNVNQLDIIVYLIEKGADLYIKSSGKIFYECLSNKDKELLRKRLPNIVNEIETNLNSNKYNL